LTGEARKDPGGRAPESNGGVGTALSHAFRIRGLPRRVGVNTQGHVCTWRRVPKKKRKAKQALLCALQACKPRAGRQAGRLDRQVGRRRSARASQCSAVRRRCATRGDQRMRRMACVETGGDQTRPDESSRVESSRVESRTTRSPRHRQMHCIGHIRLMTSERWQPQRVVGTAQHITPHHDMACHHYQHQHHHRLHLSSPHPRPRPPTHHAPNTTHHAPRTTHPLSSLTRLSSPLPHPTADPSDTTHAVPDVTSEPGDGRAGGRTGETDTAVAGGAFALIGERARVDGLGGLVAWRMSALAACAMAW
jgi:hypothetical protein